MSEITVAKTDRELDLSGYDIESTLRGGNVVLMYNKGTNASPDWIPFATATANSIEMSRDSIDIANKSMGGWMGTLAGRRSWTASLSGVLYTDVTGVGMEDLHILFNKDENIEFVFTPTNIVDVGNANAVIGKDYSALGYFSGLGNITDLSFSSDDNDGTTFDITVTGAGSLDYKTAPAGA